MSDKRLREAAKAVVDALMRCGCKSCLNFLDTNQVAALRAALEDRRKGERRKSQEIYQSPKYGRRDIRIATEDRRKGEEK